MVKGQIKGHVTGFTPRRVKMSVNGIGSYPTSVYNDKKSKKDSNIDNQKTTAGSTTTAVVYEKSNEESSKVYKRDSTTIAKLKEDAEKRTSQLKSLVEKLLLKQGEKITDSSNLYQLLQEGKVQVDDETRAQAQKDIAEDGYWGVNQTAERIVSFAKALTGSDPSKAEEMISAFQKGFDEATKTWGGTLPDLCQKTYDKVMEDLEAWKNQNNN